MTVDAGHLDWLGFIVFGIIFGSLMAWLGTTARLGHCPLHRRSTWRLLQ